jgi:hypothetical protein
MEVAGVDDAPFGSGGRLLSLTDLKVYAMNLTKRAAVRKTRGGYARRAAVRKNARRVRSVAVAAPLRRCRGRADNVNLLR